MDLESGHVMESTASNCLVGPLADPDVEQLNSLSGRSHQKASVELAKVTVRP